MRVPPATCCRYMRALSLFARALCRGACFAAAAASSLAIAVPAALLSAHAFLSAYLLAACMHTTSFLARACRGERGFRAALGVRVSLRVMQTPGSSSTGGQFTRVASAGRCMHAYSMLSGVVSYVILVTLNSMVVIGRLLVVRGLILSSKGGCNPREASRLAAVGQSIRSRAANLDRRLPTHW